MSELSCRQSFEADSVVASRGGKSVEGRNVSIGKLGKFFLSGACILTLGLTSVACIERAPTPESRRAAFDRKNLVGRVIVDQVPSSAVPVGTVFGGTVELAAYEIAPARPRLGTAATVTFYWRVIQSPEVKYRIFIHAENMGGSEGRLGADHWPAKGEYGTEMWQPGEIIRDTFKLPIPRSFDAEGVAVWTGFYFPKTPDARLPITAIGRGRSDGKNRVRVLDIPVAR